MLRIIFIILNESCKFIKNFSNVVVIDIAALFIWQLVKQVIFMVKVLFFTAQVLIVLMLLEKDKHSVSRKLITKSLP